MLCDGRIVCGCADPYGQRVLGDARDGVGARGLDRARRSPALREDLNAGGSKFCGDCPLKLPLKKDQAPPVRPLDAGPLPVAHVHRVHGGLQHLVHRGVLRAGNRHHADAPGRHARLRPVPARRSTRSGRRSAASTSSTTARRSCTSAPIEMCEYIKAQLPAHLPLHEHQRPGVHRGAGAAARALGHRRGDLLDRRRDARRATSSTGSAARFDVAIANLRAMADEKRRSGRDLPFLNWRYILFKWNDSDEEMDARAAAGRGDRRRSPVLGDHRPSRGCLLAPVRARVAGARRRSGTRPGTTTTSGNAIPGATPQRADRRAHARCPGLPLRWRRAGRPLQVRTRVRNLSTRAFPGAGHLRPPARPARRAALRRRRRADRPRLRPRLAAAAARGPASRPTSRSRFPAPDAAGPLRAEVRSGQRRRWTGSSAADRRRRPGRCGCR